MAGVVDQIICYDALTALRTFPDESIDCVITSPPYFGLRSYSTQPHIWGGSRDCDHSFDSHGTKKLQNIRDHKGYEWQKTRSEQSYGKGSFKELNLGGTCQLCGAWRGELGLEPTLQLYIEHLQTIFDEIYRVLKNTGMCWVVIGTTMKDKNDVMIPERFAISMVDHGWIKRRTVIWYKPSVLPASVKDDFTNDFEYVYRFVKQKKYYFEQQFEPYSPHSDFRPKTKSRTAGSRK